MSRLARPGIVILISPKYFPFSRVYFTLTNCSSSHFLWSIILCSVSGTAEVNTEHAEHKFGQKVEFLLHLRWGNNIKEPIILDDCSSEAPEHTEATRTVRLRILESSWEKQIIRTPEYCHHPNGASLASLSPSVRSYVKQQTDDWSVVARAAHGWYEIICHCIKNVATKGGVE